MTDLPALAAKLSEAEHKAFRTATVLVDGRVLVDAYKVPDQYTAPYSVQRTALNTLGLALRQHIMEQQK